jgi:hypothetical protein
MFPIDTVKTRIVTQHPCDVNTYTGVIDCLNKVIFLYYLILLYYILLVRRNTKYT